MPPQAPSSARQTLRQRLLAERDLFAASAAFASAEAALRGHLEQVLEQLSPVALGVYWPLRSEFNAAQLGQGDNGQAALPRALPFAQREPRAMHYRLWDGAVPTLRDECGIATASGAPVVPDVVLVPCVGYTGSGFRLGYGGGYFDRWLAAHPHVTSVGVAWSVGELGEADLAAEAHDQALTLVVTERGVI